MFVMVSRTILVRVRPDVLLIFKPFEDGSRRDAPKSMGAFLGSIKTSWTDGFSLFSWADKGQWETAEIENRRVGDWFRIGFEPVFVDFTKPGVWLIIVFLAEVSAATSLRGRPCFLIRLQL